MSIGRNAALLAAIVAGAAVGVVASGTSDAGTGPATIRITEREVRVQRINVGGRGSAGDVEIVRHQLYNLRITRKPIGHAELVCTFTGNRSSRVCRGTYFLPRGKLVVGGSVLYRQLYELAVVGGTGLYDNARGTLTVTRRTNSPVRNVVLFRLVG